MYAETVRAERVNLASRLLRLVWRHARGQVCFLNECPYQRLNASEHLFSQLGFLFSLKCVHRSQLRHEGFSGHRIFRLGRLRA